MHFTNENGKIFLSYFMEVNRKFASETKRIKVGTFAKKYTKIDVWILSEGIRK